MRHPDRLPNEVKNSKFQSSMGPSAASGFIDSGV